MLDKDSPLTDCVSQAVDALREDGTLDRARATSGWRSRARPSCPDAAPTPTPRRSDGWQPSEVQRERDACRRRRHAPQRRRRRCVSTVVAARASSAAAVVTSPGWERVQETYFDWDKAVDSFPAVLDGLWLNIRVMLVCAVLILLLGLAIAVMRTLRGPVAFPLRAARHGVRRRLPRPAAAARAASCSASAGRRST